MLGHSYGALAPKLDPSEVGEETLVSSKDHHSGGSRPALLGPVEAGYLFSPQPSPHPPASKEAASFLLSPALSNLSVHGQPGRARSGNSKCEGACVCPVVSMGTGAG